MRPTEPPPDVFAALAHPTRRQILDLLRTGQPSLTFLASNLLPLSRRAIFQHLRVLLTVGLLTEQRVGRERHYHVQVAQLHAVQAWLDGFWV